MNMYYLYGLIICVLLGIAAIALAIYKIREFHRAHILGMFKTIQIIFVLIAAILAFGGSYSFWNLYEEMIKEIEIDVSEKDYEIYVDGQLVELENVNLDDYNITIDDEKRKIFLTK